MNQVATGEVERPKLKTGMILLDPNNGRPQVWTVATEGRRPRLIAHYGGVAAEGTMNLNGLPDGWHILSNADIAKKFRGMIASG